MTSLHGAVSLVEMHHVAMVVSQQLHLDMFRTVQESLNEDCAVAKRIQSFGCCPGERIFQALLLPNDSHASTTASEGSFNDDGKAIFVREFFDLFKLCNCTLCAGYTWHIGFLCEVSCGDLVSKVVDRFRGGTDPLDGC